MAFIVLGSVGSALASGLAAVGLGTVGTAAAAGTGLAGAIGSAAGAATGIGTGIAGTIASGLGAAGLGTAAAPSALASAIGTGATTAAGSAGIGAGMSAATGGDPGQGALFGAAGGALAGGLGSLAGSGSGAAGSAVGDGLTTASEAMLNPTAAAAAPGVQTVGDAVTQTAMGQVGAPITSSVADAASAASAGGGSMFDGMGKDLAEEGLKMAMAEDEQRPRFASPSSIRPQSPYDELDAQGPMFGGGFMSNPFASFAEGGLTTLKGGGIAMRDGQYVIPADVVSAIGNGSSKAGAKFLEQAFNYYMENGPPQGVQPPQRAGSLAAQRMAERTKRQSV